MQASSPSGANIRDIRHLCKTLNISSLILKNNPAFSKKHHFSMRNGPFQRLKSTVSHPDTGLIGLQNGHYQNAKCVFSDYYIGYIKRRNLAEEAS